MVMSEEQKMKNLKLIIINGMDRGATSILWNLLVSRLKVVLVRLETGHIFKFFSKRNILRIFREDSLGDKQRIGFEKEARSVLDYFDYSFLSFFHELLI
jgi:hypothetical protein